MEHITLAIDENHVDDDDDDDGHDVKWMREKVKDIANWTKNDFKAKLNYTKTYYGLLHSHTHSLTHIDITLQTLSLSIASFLALHSFTFTISFFFGKI